MPTRPATICISPGCPRLAVADARCAEHATTHRAERRLTETPRLSFRQRGYGREWESTRARVLRLTPTCRVCGAPATVVDHIRPLRAGGTHDLSNLQALCRPCHQRKTNAVDGGGWQQRPAQVGRGDPNFRA